jgi:hypothetical protein
LFQRVDRHIRTHLETVLPPTASIPLTPAGDCYYEGSVTDHAAWATRWVLALRAVFRKASWMTQTPNW